MYFCIIFEMLKRCAVPKVDGFHVGGRKDMTVGGWGPGNPYCVKIVISVRNIGPSLTVHCSNSCPIWGLSETMSCFRSGPEYTGSGTSR